MADSIKKQKPKKPRVDFPLYAHANGSWAKKIRGKRYYFGPWSDPEGALNKYLDEKDDRFAGRTPRMHDGRMTLHELVNMWDKACSSKVSRGELAQQTLHGYRRHSKMILECLDKKMVAEEFTPTDFEAFRGKFPESWGPVAAGMVITVTKMIFRYGWENDLMEKPVKFGPGFKKPSQRILRKDRQARRQEHGKRMFEAKDLRLIIKNAPQPLRAMIYLGINCGMGQSDCANLPMSALDLDYAWMDYARPKTGIDRQCPLWPETVASLRVVIEKRPTNQLPADDSIVFLTAKGNRWVRVKEGGSPDDAVSKRFGKLLTDLKLKRHGLNFYALRHTFQTVAEETKDIPAVRQIMGHVDPHVSASYREEIAAKRLKAAVNHVHGWLFGKKISNLRIDNFPTIGQNGNHE